MKEVAEIESRAVREEIMNFEAVIGEHPKSFRGDTDICPLRHSFTDGIYVREIFIPAGTVLTGKIHKHAHPNFLMVGIVEVITESGGRETLTAPVSMISEAGTKRVVHALTDVVWITVHKNKQNITDLDKLEEMIIAPDYKSYHKYIESQDDIWNRIHTFVKKTIKKLSK